MNIREFLKPISADSLLHFRKIISVPAFREILKICPAIRRKMTKNRTRVFANWQKVENIQEAAVGF